MAFLSLYSKFHAMRSSDDCIAWNTYSHSYWNTLIRTLIERSSWSRIEITEVLYWPCCSMAWFVSSCLNPDCQPSSSSMLYPLNIAISHEKDTRTVQAQTYKLCNLELYQLKQPYLSSANDQERTLLLLYLATAKRDLYPLFWNYSQFQATPIILYIILK